MKRLARILMASVALLCSASMWGQTDTLIFVDTDYVPSGSFVENTDAEVIMFNGMIGHIDGYQIRRCPKLKKVVFNGPVLSTGGPVFAEDCPELEEIQLNGLCVGMGLVQNPGCPKLKPIVVNGAVYSSSDTLAVPNTPIAVIAANPECKEQLRTLLRWATETMSKKGFLKKLMLRYAPELKKMADGAGLTVESAMIEESSKANADPDAGKSKLQVLKEAAPYAEYTGEETIEFTYTPPSDSLLTRSREYFNLDSIAGNGDDVSRIKNLLYWVHDLVRHNGSSSWPDCHYNLVDLYEVCRDQNRGVNCRFMAMMLTEALLAEGIPARYLTCLPKAYDEDSDCHVITIAWAESLGKWIWVDPTFAAFVTDENGLLLHPGEVRYRLQHDMPLVLNEDANWNHVKPAVKSEYLDYYMAKNLYAIDSRMHQSSEPEGKKSRSPKSRYVCLAPVGFDYTNTHIVMSDDKLFWQKP